MKRPMCCEDVKCMQQGCLNVASHKVGEYNIYDEELESEEYKAFDRTHELTTYLCEEHFKTLMTRDTHYGDISKYKNI